MTIVRMCRWAAALTKLLSSNPLAALLGQPAAAAQQRQSYVYPGAEWERIAAPESAGYSSSGLAAARAKLTTTASNGFIAVVGGRVLFEYGDIDTVSYIASARKSVLSMLYGIYVGRGAIDLEQTLERLGIDDVGGLTRAEREATIRHLLTARSGIYHPAANAAANPSANPGDDLASAPPRGSQRPGDYFLYNNWDFNALGTIFEKVTHQNIYDALQREIVDPIGMQDFQRGLHRRTGDSASSIHLAYHMFFSVRDMARIGYLMLRGGTWSGRQIVPATWVRESTRPITPLNEMHPAEMRGGPWGYGYLWWVWDGPNTPSAYKGAFTAAGAFGQYIAVLPALDLVVAHKTVPGDNRSISPGEFLTVLDLVVQARTGAVQRVAIRLSDAVLQRYVGVYELVPGATMTITLENSQLFAQLTRQPKAAILPESETTFFYRATNAQIRFTTDSVGAVTGLILQQSGGRANPARRLPPRH